MSKKKKREKILPEICPLCGRNYSNYRQRSMHHVLPKTWYHGGGPLAEICVECHREFNIMFPMRYVWSTTECISKFATFCEYKGKHIFNVYPHLQSYYYDEIIGVRNGKEDNKTQ